MGQSLSFEQLQCKFVDIVIFSIYMHTIDFTGIEKICTYKQLLKLLLQYWKKYDFDSPSSNVISYSWFFGGYTYCDKYVEYQIWDSDKYDHKDREIMDVKINNEYLTIDIFHKILEAFKLKSLDVEINDKLIKKLKEVSKHSINNPDLNLDSEFNEKIKHFVSLL